MIRKHALVVGVLVFEVMLFALASLAHGGWLIQGYEHTRAAIVEAGMAVLLAVGFVISVARPQSCRAASMFVQGFAALGVCAGLATIALGIGPRTTLDLALDGIMLLTLLVGFLLSLRSV